MIAATVIMIAGVALIALCSQLWGYRLGGVMVLPLLAIYTFREPLSPVIFAAGAGAAWLSLWVTREYTLNHGRRLFIIAVTSGAIVTIIAGFALSQLLPARFPFESAVVYALGATVVFFLISLVHWVTLFYGRVLLGISLPFGALYALLVGVWQPATTPGIVLFFTGLFTGIGAYNLHRVAPKDRTAHIRLSAGLFVAFYAVILAFVDVPPEGLLSSLDWPHAVLGVAVVGFAAVELVRLERSIPDARAFARESVFANAPIEGADMEESPLVATQGDER